MIGNFSDGDAIKDSNAMPYEHLTAHVSSLPSYLRHYSYAESNTRKPNQNRNTLLPAQHKPRTSPDPSQTD